MGSDVSDFNLFSRNENGISERTINRLRQYSCILDTLEGAGNCNVSSSEIAKIAGVKSGLVRKDLCRFGGFGRPSVGYNISYLRKQIHNILGLNEEKLVALVGEKILQYEPSLTKRLAANNYRINMIFTFDSTNFEPDINHIPIDSASDISKLIKNAGIKFAIISEFTADCQSVVDRLVSGGVKAILNLAPNVITVPDGVAIRHIDIPGELIALSFKCSNKFDIIDNDAV
ncbi:MAG: redox-sensing transcriptional repressor Rex [Armatimonadota bacterium]